MLALIASIGIALACVAVYVKEMTPIVTLRADILMWGETAFVADVIKLEGGLPLYGPPEDSNALIYTPLAPIVTWAVASALGDARSVATLRLIQWGYLVVAGLIALASVYKLRALLYPDARPRFDPLFGLLALASLLLAATAPSVNHYVHCLHPDALAMVVSMAAFWSLLHYLEKPSRPRLVSMAVIVAVGYLTKQFLVSWSVVMGLVLFFDRPRDWRRLALFAVVATAAIGGTMGACLLIWGDNFRFWTFEIMGGVRRELTWNFHLQQVSLSRALDHAIRAIPVLGLGLVGIWILLRDGARRVLPLALGWLALLASEILSSGASWNVFYHLGPGVVLGTVWLLVALSRVWPGRGGSVPAGSAERWLEAGVAVLGVTMTFAVLQVLPAWSESTHRSKARIYDWYGEGREEYVSAIEREFVGQDPARVLLDVGNWVYLPSLTLQRDRAVSLGDQPLGGIYENFEPLLTRIRERYYDRILVRNWGTKRFLYDWDGWPRPSGVAAALEQHYRVVRTIPAASEFEEPLRLVRVTGEVSVLEPINPRDEE